MAVSNPTYITKSKHGVYYFQLLVSKGIAERIGIQSSRYTRSLRTKDKRVALAKAKKIQSRFHFLVMSSGKGKIKNQLDALFEEDEHSQALLDSFKESKIIHTAISVTDRYDELDNLDYDREMFFDGLSHEEQTALKYVSDKGISLDDYKNKKAVTSDQTVSAVAIDPRYAYLKSKKLSLVLADYIEGKQLEKPNWLQTSKADRIARLFLFVDIVGDIDSSELSHDHLESYKRLVIRLPMNRTKLMTEKNQTIHELCEFDYTDDQRLAPKTIKDYTETLRGFLEWAIKRDFVASNMLIPLEKFYTKVDSWPYLAFDDDDLEKLFMSVYYQKGLHRTPSNYWIPLTALYTGARENEICQLSVSDVCFGEAKIWYFDLNERDGKRVKNTSSRRLIPIHQELIKMGFLDYVEELKTRQIEKLFPDIKLTNGKHNGGFSKWFNRTYRKNCDVGMDGDKTRRKNFHSFRKTIASALERKNVSMTQIGQILGHTSKGVTEKYYVTDMTLKEKANNLKKVSYKFDHRKIKLWKFHKEKWFGR